MSRATIERDGYILLPGLSTARARRWAWLFVAILVGVPAWYFVMHPEYRTNVLVMTPILWLMMLALPWATYWIHPTRGEVLRMGWGRIARRVPLCADTEVVFAPTGEAAMGLTGAGNLLLGLRPAGARTRVYLLVLAANQYLEQSMAPEHLRLLADLMDQHGARGTHQGKDIATALRAQADHVAHGGDVRTSPLAEHLNGPGAR